MEIMHKKIVILVGSLRKDSTNRKIAKELIRLSSERLNMEIVEVGQLPLYNEDFDSNPPAEWTEFKNKIEQADGILIVSPEYNRSIPGALKNAIDVGSRPYGKNSWAAKPGGIVTSSPSGIGGAVANHHIRQAMVFVDVPIMQQPEAYISGSWNIWKDDGVTVDEKTEPFLKSWITAFENWVYKF